MFSLLILIIFKVYIITPSLHETTEAKQFMQGHIAEMAFKPGSLQSPCSNYYMAPFPAPKQPLQGHHCGSSLAYPLPPPWLFGFTVGSIHPGVSWGFMAVELQERVGSWVNSDSSPSALNLGNKHSFNNIEFCNISYHTCLAG